MTLKGKIALIIVVPLYGIMILTALIVSILLWIIGSILNWTGIGEAFEYLGKKIRTEGIRSKFQKLRKSEGLKK